jgi:hypothetical protein
MIRVLEQREAHVEGVGFGRFEGKEALVLWAIGGAERGAGGAEAGSCWRGIWGRWGV